MTIGTDHTFKADTVSSPSKLIAVTLRLDEARYQRLKLYGLKRRLTNQQILVQALDHILGTAEPT